MAKFYRKHIPETGITINSIRGSFVLYFLLFLLLVFVAYIAYYISCHAGNMEKYAANSTAHADLINFNDLVESFYSDYEEYPQSFPLTTGNILVSDGEHEASFSTSKGVYLIFNSNGDKHSVITTHLSGDRFYSISSSIDWIMHRIRKIGCLNFLFQSEEGRLSDMKSCCLVPGQEKWDGWELNSKRRR